MKKAVDHLVEHLDGLASATAMALGSGLGGFVDEVGTPSAFLMPRLPRSGVACLFVGQYVIMMVGHAHH